MSDHRANLESSLSHFMTHTKSSAPKFPGQLRTVVPAQPTHFVGEGGNAAAGAPRKTPQGALRAARERDFGGSQVFAAIRGNNAGSVSSPQRGRSYTPPPGEAASLQRESSTVQGRSISLCKEASGISRSNFMNQQNHSLHGPDPTIEQKPQQRMWLSKPLSNGARFMPMKRRYDSPSRTEFVGAGLTSLAGAADSPANSRTNSPVRTGKRQIGRPDSIVGCDVNVVTEPRPITPHRINRYHGTKPPYLTRRSESPDSAKPAGGPSGQKHVTLEVGLTGYGPTGRKKIDAAGQGMTLLDHPQPRSASEARALTPPRREPRGPMKVPGKSDDSVVPWDLKSYTAEQLNEKKWKPSSVPMSGPPAFHPTNSPPRSRGISSPGRRRIDHGSSNIFPMPHEVPHLRNPHHSPAAGNSPGRQQGRYSPLRQAPPSTYPTSSSNSPMRR